MDFSFDFDLDFSFDFDFGFFFEDFYEYIDGEINGKVKYINSNSEVFEGYYKNGIKIVLSKEYYLLFKEQKKINILKFEGEFFNGKKWNGKGKEYYCWNTNLMLFEGEYLNGKKWNGKGYTKEGKEDFEINEGKGYLKKINSEDMITSEGEYINGEKKWYRERI